MSAPKRILLLTNSEFGQANVFLAVSYELLTLQNENVEVHFASFSRVENDVKLTSQMALAERPASRPIVFHRLQGSSMREIWTRPDYLADQAAVEASNLLVHWLRKRLRLLRGMLPWTGPEFAQVFDSVVHIVGEVQPDAIAVDAALSPGLTALKTLGSKFSILAPNTIKDFAMMFQPNLEALWKYPALDVACDFPVPLYYTPVNVFLILLLVACVLLDPHRREVQQHMLKHASGAKITTIGDLVMEAKPTCKFLVANTKALEFRLGVFPEHIIPCGPMLRQVHPVEEVDPELAAWLVRGPTVYINLGTLFKFTQGFAIEMAKSIRILLAQCRAKLQSDKKLDRLQIFWKLQTDGSYDISDPSGPIHEILGKEIDADVVRVVDWIQAEPCAILQQWIVCAVHHGGANSFLEIASAGVPQVVLPAWVDCFDFARRAELLGIGRRGNKGSIDQCHATELGPILVDVVASERSSGYAKRAQEMADECNRPGMGRTYAARYILKEAGRT